MVETIVTFYLSIFRIGRKIKFLIHSENCSLKILLTNISNDSIL